MSDIAMLVAEEYERRVSILRKASVVDGVGISQERMEEGASVLAERLMKHKREVLKWALEPKSQVGVAASASFFSA